MQLIRSGRGARGFTLIELMVTVSIVALLSALAVPSFRTWIANAKVRATTEAVMSQVRLAQAEAVKRYRRVVLYRAAAGNCATAPDVTSGGNTWVIKTIALYTGDVEEVVQCGNLSDTAADVLNGPDALCFGTNGWPAAVADPNIGGTACTVPVTPYTVSKTGGDRTLSVVIGLGGNVRMCDASKTLSATNPDGC